VSWKTSFSKKQNPCRGETNDNSIMRTIQPSHSRVALAVLLLSFLSPEPSLAQLTPVEALADLEVYEGLEVTLFASEPMILSPTNLDIDHRGRVWICEVVNYHRNRGRRPEGDRILILEDRDGDGRADDVKVFHQGTSIDSAMGICVLGNRVVVTASPNVFVFTDTDGDDRADKKEVLFTKTGHPEHDHSAHSASFGPDGKLYWNFGNTGQAVHDRNGATVVDVLGHPVVDKRSPYQGGMQFRCNLDGSEFEVLGHNFRNNYEGAVDSFGNVWQTDNDDDGNRGARMSFVLEGGNFGYRDEITGAAWRTARTGQHEDVGHRHFHQNDPGVVPNLIMTGNGAPSGITVYEGRLLPKIFHDRPIHGDTVTNVVHGNVIHRSGAGFGGKATPLLRSRRDKWFRPVDVCVAPDGSLFVTDWYDPGVGGHRQADTTRGRVYRIAPPEMPYRTKKVDVSTHARALEALKSPNAATRYLAWMKLHEAGDRAEGVLQRLLLADELTHRARGLWLLGKIEGRGQRYVDRALNSGDAPLRVVGVRLARQIGLDLEPILAHAVKDPSPAVRRECAIALRGNRTPWAAELWAELANRHDGEDRWFLESLGISAAGDWDARFAAWLETVDAAKARTKAYRDLVWRSRAETALPLLAKLILDPSIDPRERLRYFRAFDFHDSSKRDDILLELATTEHRERATITKLALAHYRGKSRPNGPKFRAALDAALDATRATPEFVTLLRRFDLRERADALVALAFEATDNRLVDSALDLARRWNAHRRIAEKTRDEDSRVARRAVALLVRHRTRTGLDAISAVVTDVDRSLDDRRFAISTYRGHRPSEQRLLRLLLDGAIPESLHLVTANVLLSSGDEKIRERAAEKLELPLTADEKPIPTIAELERLRGDAARGRDVFAKAGKCSTCHLVGGEGKAVGPDLSTVGKKLGRSSLFESILFPSLGISHGFETSTVISTKGDVITGIVKSRSEESTVLVTAEGVTRTFAKDEINTLRREPNSLMPGDLYKTLSRENLIDLVEYMSTLR